MTAPRTRVVGPVVLPDGSPAVAHAEIVFTLSSWDRAGGSVVMSGAIIAKIENGAIDVDLFRTTSGARGTPYDVAYRYWSTVAGSMVSVNLGRIALTGPGPVTLADLLAVPAPIPTVPDALAQTLAAAAEAKAMVVNADRVAADRAAAEAARDAAASVGIVNRGWVTNAAALANISGPVLNDRAMTLNDEHVHRYNGSAWIDQGLSPISDKANKTAVIASVNLYNASLARNGFYWSPGSNKIAVQAGYKVMSRVAVIPGERLYVANGLTAQGIGFSTTDEDAPASASTVALAAGFGVVTVPAGMRFMQANLLVGSGDVTADFFVARASKPLPPSIYAERLRRDQMERETPSDLLVRGPNLFDARMVMRSALVGINGTIGYNALTRLSGFIKVLPGASYRIGGVSDANGLLAAAFSEPNALATGTYLGGYSLIGSTTGSVTIPMGREWLVFEIRRDGGGNADLDANVTIEPVDQARDAFAAGQGINPKYLPASTLMRPQVIEPWSFNLINPAKVDYSKRYSTGSKTMIAADINSIAASGYVPVKEGQLYIISGTGIFNGYQGGYFAGPGLIAAIDNIAFASPPTGSGRMFQVPVGLGITHVVISLASSDHVTLSGDAQMERGEVATAYQPYQERDQIREDLLPAGSSGGGGGGSVSAVLDAKAWYNFVEADGGGSDLSHKLPLFREKWLKRNADLVVVNTGTSLTARSSEHCPLHPQAAFRPPLMHSYNCASHIWDKLKWEGQQYRRYDAPAFFSEVGAWATGHALAEWDDGAYRAGLTRHSEAASASVSFTIPAGAWAVRFIYRTDSLGCDANVNVAGGNGLVQAFDDDTETWVEANGFAFSQYEAAPVARNVVVPNSVTGATVTQSLTSKGNTTYQKRLKLRVINRTAARAITFARAGGGARMMYWGVEWSPREHMVTYVNAARGSHNSGVSAQGLTRFQDNEVWGFKPDLMLFENPIHNDGAAGAGGAYAEGTWAWLTERFVWQTGFELSMAGSCVRLGMPFPEIAIHTASIAWNFGGIEDDGSLKFGASVASVIGPAKMMTALDRFAEAHLHVVKNHPEAVAIHAAQRWVDAGLSIFGNLRAATEGSGTDGDTFTNEGSHWNRTGGRIMAKCIVPVIPRIW